MKEHQFFATQPTTDKYQALRMQLSLWLGSGYFWENFNNDCFIIYLTACGKSQFWVRWKYVHVQDSQEHHWSLGRWRHHCCPTMNNTWMSCQLLGSILESTISMPWKNLFAVLTEQEQMDEAYLWSILLHPHQQHFPRTLQALSTRPIVFF